MHHDAERRHYHRGISRTALRAVRHLEGQERTASEAGMIFDSSTLLPVRLHYENSPAPSASRLSTPTTSRLPSEIQPDAPP